MTRTPWLLAMTCFTAGITAHLACAAAMADSATDSVPEAWAFKLTPSVYATDHEHNAVDLNLRAHHGPHALWVGQYQRGDEFKQTRIGYEYTANYDWGQVVPSLQAATGGFAGGSLTLQIGHPVFAIVGWGRTNLRDYYNLNFDPNDMVTLGLGARLEGGHQLSLFTVKDNRLATDQAITHGVWRWQANEAERWTLDLAHKQGRPTAEAPHVAGDSLSLTFDHRRVFVHAAYDQKVNFSANNQTRISVGLRF